MNSITSTTGKAGGTDTRMATSTLQPLQKTKANGSTSSRQRPALLYEGNEAPLSAVSTTATKFDAWASPLKTTLPHKSQEREHYCLLLILLSSEHDPCERKMFISARREPSSLRTFRAFRACTYREYRPHRTNVSDRWRSSSEDVPVNTIMLLVCLFYRTSA